MNIKSKFKQHKKAKQIHYLLVVSTVILLIACSIYFLNNGFFSSDDQDNHLSTNKSINLNWKKGYLDVIKKFYADNENNSDCRYSLYDMNNDGIPELFLNTWYRNNLVYTLNNDKVVLVGETYNEIYKSIDNNGVVSFGGWGTGIGGAILYTMDNLSLKEETILTYNAMLPSNPTTYEDKDKQLSQEEFEEAQSELTANPLEMYPMSDELIEEDLNF